MDRKEFIRSAARLMILGLFVIFTGGLIYRRRITLENTCGLAGDCSRCGSFSTCNLPEALKYKENEKAEDL